MHCNIQCQIAICPVMLQYSSMIYYFNHTPTAYMNIAVIITYFLDPARFQDTWRLSDGFVAAEAKVVLPHRARSRWR